ncbi:MAG TPA: hypothetical protein VE422_10985 [Terriglobia bacterium]|nr:hypothetical protein [Terriglobia bacterium]
MYLKRFSRCCAVLLFVFSGKAAMAQSTIFNIPTTDAVAKGKVYFEFDYLHQTPKTEGADRLHIIVPRGVVGLGGNVEAGANVAFFHSGGTTNSYFQPNIKWKFASSDDRGFAASMGGILYTPINTPPGVDTYGLVYGNFSKKVKHHYGPRFTAGPYGIVSGGADWVGPKGGVILGYEQPIHAKASIVADWFSGKNGFGYFTPGVSFTLPASGLLNIGYSLGNDSYNGNNNRFLFLYYGITF